MEQQNNIFISNKINQSINPITIVHGQVDWDNYWTRDLPYLPNDHTEYMYFNRILSGEHTQQFTFDTVFMVGTWTITINLQFSAELNTQTTQYTVQGSATLDGVDYKKTKVLNHNDTASLDLPIGNSVCTIKLSRFKPGELDNVEVDLSATGEIPAIGNNANYHLPILQRNASSIPLLDIGGEGRIFDTDYKPPMVTGFHQAYNLNAVGQRISNGPKKREGIPNKLNIIDWKYLNIPIPDNSVRYMTMMGVPIKPIVVSQMMQKLNKTRGVVILYGFKDSAVSAFESWNGNLVPKPNSNKEPRAPFGQPTLRPVRFYGFPNSSDRDEL